MDPPVQQPTVVVDFLMPLGVAILSGLVIYGAALWRQRRAAICALISEINSHLRSCVEWAQFFERVLPAWTNVGERLGDYPIYEEPSYDVFNAVVPHTYLLRKAELVRVLEFYSGIRETEGLIGSLFVRIKALYDSGEPLLPRDVARMSVRVQRIRANLISLSKVMNGRICKLGELPDSYDFISLEKTLEEWKKIHKGGANIGHSRVIEPDRIGDVHPSKVREGGGE